MFTILVHRLPPVDASSFIKRSVIVYTYTFKRLKALFSPYYCYTFKKLRGKYFTPK